MNYMGDSHWWNERFKIRKLNIMTFMGQWI